TAVGFGLKISTYSALVGVTTISLSMRWRAGGVMASTEASCVGASELASGPPSGGKVSPPTMVSAGPRPSGSGGPAAGVVGAPPAQAVSATHAPKVSQRTIRLVSWAVRSRQA